MMIASYGLSKHFPVRGAFRAKTVLRAVDDAELQIKENQIVGLVGESGSGKSTLGRLLIRLLEPTSGEVLFDVPDDVVKEYEAARASQDKKSLERIEGKYSLVQKSSGEMRRLRSRMNIVFQDPYSSLNPRMHLSSIIAEPMVSTGFCTRAEAKERAVTLLEEVGLPAFFEDRYPHELSGGQRQRVAVARAISTNPKLLILDEPTSALDVSVQAQVLNMLRDLRDKYGVSMLLITHNIAVVAYLAERVYVMYAGKIMEVGAKGRVLRNPDHPYTKALMSAVPIAGEKRTRTILRGDPPNLIVPPAACRFHPRCPVAFAPCGWTSDEVAEDLTYLLTGKYFSTFGDALNFRSEDPMVLEIEGTEDEARIREIVAGESEDVRSLKAIKSVDRGAKVQDGPARVVIRLHDAVDPEMYLTAEGTRVKCLLFREDGSPAAGAVAPEATPGTAG